MNIILYLSSKYLKFKASDRGISTIAIIALFTIIISSTASVVILSAANGFHHNFMQKLMSKDAHVIILGPGKGIEDYEYYIEKLTNIKGVIYAMPYFDKQALLKGNLNVWGALLKGIPTDLYKTDPDFSNNFKIEDGDFNLDKPKSIILGYNLAINLGVSVGNYVDVTVYSDEYFSLQYRFYVAGIFTAGYAEYDSSLAFISFKDAQEISDAFGYAYGIALKVKDPFNIEKYLPEIKKVCPYYFWSWKTLNRNNLYALQNEKLLIRIILFIFFFVVGFNILSTMIAMVIDKKEEIAIIKAIGLKPSSTLYVFLFNGFLLGFIGSFIGIISGLLVTLIFNNILHSIEHVINFVNYSAYYLISWTKLVPMPAKFEFFKSSVYYINQFPIKIQMEDIIFVISLSVILSTLSVIIPARNASKLRPIEVLRND